MTSPRPPATGLRRAVEERSRPVLVALSRQPKALLPLLSAALLAGVVFGPGSVSLLCIVLLVVLVGWLSYLSWPAVDARGRLVRVAALVLLVVLGVQSVLP